jgi:TPR repeat protein
MIYDLGMGVRQDYAEAAKWYRLAAEQGYSFGQLGLGSLYWAGRSLPQDDVAAYMWFSLAAAQGLADAAKLRDLTAQPMTKDEPRQGTEAGAGVEGVRSLGAWLLLLITERKAGAGARLGGPRYG